MFVYLAAFRSAELGVGAFRWDQPHSCGTAGVPIDPPKQALPAPTSRALPQQILGVSYADEKAPARPRTRWGLSSTVCTRRLVEAQDSQKMLLLLEYLFDRACLVDCAREGWIKYFDTAVGGRLAQGA